MLEETIGFLNLKKGDTVVDATIGGCGHSRKILERVLPGGRLIVLDADASALEITGNALQGFEGSFKLVHDNFRNLDVVLSQEGVGKVDAFLFDVGLSSYQIEDAVRGFSIQRDARLDMRMDPRLNVTAYDIVNTYKERELSDILERFGEERFHNRIAR